MKERQLTELYLKNTLDEKKVDTILKLDYKGGRGHFKINLLAVEKVADFAKILNFVGDTDIFVFDPGEKIEQIQKYVAAAVETLKEYRNRFKDFSDEQSKKATADANTLLKRFISFNTKLQKRFPLYNIPDITDDESTIKTKKQSYYISVINENHEKTVELVNGFSFHAVGHFCGVHKCENGYYNVTLLCCGIAITRNHKSKKAAITETLRVLKKVKLTPETLKEAVTLFRTLAEKVNADLSYLPEPETVVAHTEPPTEPETVETVETPRRLYGFTPLSPGERHAAAIAQENAAPPLMVVIWLYIAVLQKHLFSVSHTLELCHVPVYGFTRLLYTVVVLLLYHASLSGLFSGLPSFVMSNFKRDRGGTFPCTGSGLSALLILFDAETVSGLTRLTDCRNCYHDTS